MCVDVNQKRTDGVLVHVSNIHTQNIMDHDVWDNA
jgi:hypothetical protein